MQFNPNPNPDILIIDDEEMILLFTRKMLEKSGFQVTTACNGTEGVERLQENLNSIQTVLLDISLPCLSGEEVFRLLLDIKPSLRIILCSGLPPDLGQFQTSHPETPEVHYLKKPFYPNELVSLLKS